MLNATFLIAAEQFTLLRRDKFFVPAFVISVGITLLANLAMDWTVEEFDKILYDIGYFGFQFTGCAVALLWGVKSVTDSRQEGSIEYELAAPISRTSWLLGKYLGLALGLVLFGAMLLAVWQGIMLVNGYGWMHLPQVNVFLFMVLGWLVVGALAICCSSFMGHAVAMFVSFSFWIVGLATSLVMHTLGPDTPVLTQFVVKGVTRLWDLQQFNLVDHALKASVTQMSELGYRAAYGGLLILSLMTVACLIFQRRDVIN